MSEDYIPSNTKLDVLELLSKAAEKYGKDGNSVRSGLVGLLAMAHGEIERIRGSGETEAVGWQPIDTAPKNKDILLFDRFSETPHEGKWFAGIQLQYCFGFVPDDGWYWAGYGSKPVGPMAASHWQPLPAKPELKANEQQLSAASPSTSSMVLERASLAGAGGHCCDDFEAALQGGTDNEGYQALIQERNGQWVTGYDLRPIVHCSWCGAKPSDPS